MGEGFVIFILFWFFVFFEEFFFYQSVHWKPRQSNRLTVPRDHPSLLPLLSLSVFTCVFFFLNFCLLCLSIFLPFLFFSRSFSLSLSLSHTHTHFLCFSILLSAYCSFLGFFICPLSFFCDFIPVCILFLSVFLSHFSLMCLFMFLYHLLLSYILFLSCSIFLAQVKKIHPVFSCIFSFFFKKVLFILSNHFHFCIILAFSYEVFSSLFNFCIYYFSCNSFLFVLHYYQNQNYPSFFRKIYESSFSLNY